MEDRMSARQESIDFRSTEDYYLVAFRKPARMFSSAPFGGGIGPCNAYINRHVALDYASEPDEEVKEFLKKIGVGTERICVTLTACDVGKYSHSSFETSGGWIEAWVTAGIENALSIGSAGLQGPGTINIALATNYPLSDSGAMNLVQSIVEAKSQALHDSGVADSATGKSAPGTSTDTVSLFVLTEASSERYGGRLTEIGMATSVILHDLVRDAIGKCGK